jgi:hypothetical protein
MPMAEERKISVLSPEVERQKLAPNEPPPGLPRALRPEMRGPGATITMVSWVMATLPIAVFQFRLV